MSTITKRIFATIALLLLAAASTGCGSGNKEGSTGTSGSALYGGVATVNETACASCHGSTIDPVTGEPVYSNATDNAGYINSTHSRAYGCQGCHGGGAGHNGVGPLPFPDPSLSSGGQSHCATCHSDATIVSTVNTSIAKYIDSRHAIGDLHVEQTCNRCHTHKGAILSNISGYTGDKDFLTANLAIAPAAMTEAEALHIKCNTCHVSHRPENLRTVTGWSPSITLGSTVDTGNAQYKLCTSCHTYLNPDGAVVASGNNGTAPFEHNTRWYRIIASTHYDNPATPAETVGAVPGKVEGYVLRTNGTNPCLDCHGHEFLTNTRQDETPLRPATIYTDWAKSAHGGRLLTAKYAAAAAAADKTAAQVDAVLAAASIDDADIGAPAWTHYNWDQVTGTGNRASCERCHTSTGTSNYMNNPTTYVAANNTFNHLSGWTAATGSPQNELLYCWGCHSNAGKGVLRTPGAITETYSPATTGDPATTVTYPDVSGSNVCMTCHLGRETGEVVKNDQDADGVRSFVNSHYLTAGGQLFGTTGYEYAGLSYANPSFFKHDLIGSSSAPGTGTNGPCAGCHMRTPNSHSFLPVTKNTTGTITAITSTACATCHSGGFALTPAGLTTEEEEYQAALSALTAALDSKGIYYNSAYPYFFTGPNGTGGAFTNWASVYGLALWKDVMGAAFNANLLINDPGGFAHNRFYSKRLIWDSIDFIYNGILDNDVPAAIDAVVTDPTIASAAKTYLGTTRP